MITSLLREIVRAVKPFAAVGPRFRFLDLTPKMVLTGGTGKSAAFLADQASGPIRTHDAAYSLDLLRGSLYNTTISTSLLGRFSVP